LARDLGWHGRSAAAPGRLLPKNSNLRHWYMLGRGGYGTRCRSAQVGSIPAPAGEGRERRSANPSS
jgi:hypothetical protein